MNTKQEQLRQRLVRSGLIEADGGLEASDPFLKALNINSERSAVDNSVESALQHSKTYASTEETPERQVFRTQWKNLIRDESQRYERSVADIEHCTAIQRISAKLRGDFGPLLSGGQLRFGVSQKALNLYLKFLWRMKKITVVPPHCPIDRDVLKFAGVNSNWTECDSEKQYMGWITALRMKVNPLSLSEWEHDFWYQNYLKRSTGA